jgi:hypothetical protein
MLGPMFMGAAMAGAMLWMLHDQLMAQGVASFWLIFGFVAVHGAVVGLVGLLALLIPGLRKRIGRHRPSLGHLGAMAAGLILTVAAVHLAIHGGVA